MLPGVSRQASNSPKSLTTKWSLKSKNQPKNLLHSRVNTKGVRLALEFRKKLYQKGPFLIRLQFAPLCKNITITISITLLAGVVKWIKSNLEWLMER